MDEYVYTVSRMLDVWMDGLESSSIIIVKTLDDNIIVKAFEQQLTVPKLAVSSQRKRIFATSLL